MQVSKWGNSLAIRLPAELVEKLKLRAGDELAVRAAGPIGFSVEREMTREEAIEALRTAGSPLPADYRFSRDEANAR
jgi:antitoxin MazE